MNNSVQFISCFIEMLLVITYNIKSSSVYNILLFLWEYHHEIIMERLITR